MESGLDVTPVWVITHRSHKHKYCSKPGASYTAQTQPTPAPMPGTPDAECVLAGSVNIAEGVITITVAVWLTCHAMQHSPGAHTQHPCCFRPHQSGRPPPSQSEHQHQGGSCVQTNQRRCQRREFHLPAPPIILPGHSTYHAGRSGGPAAAQHHNSQCQAAKVNPRQAGCTAATGLCARNALQVHAHECLWQAALRPPPLSCSSGFMRQLAGQQHSPKQGIQSTVQYRCTSLQHSRQSRPSFLTGTLAASCCCCCKAPSSEQQQAHDDK